MDKRDEDLIHEYQLGNEEALTMLFERYKRPILNYALRILGNRADAEDVAGEVFLALFEKKDSYQPQAKFSTWLYTIARNNCISRIRKRKFQISLWFEKDETGELQCLDIPDDKNLPPQELARKETSFYLRRAIAKLPLEQKEALILREYQQLSYEEISQVLGCSLEKVKVVIFRAREKLREELPSFIKEER